MNTQKCFVLDLNLCTGCHACQLACKIENEIPAGMSWRQVVTFNEARLPHIPVFSLSLACNHCVDAHCLESCPALAYHKDPGTGAVTVTDAHCMGCRYCIWVCPYDAPKLNVSTGVVEKCTFCFHRLREGLEPACTLSCPTGALRLGEYSSQDATAENIPGFWRRTIEPAIRIEPLQRGLEPPRIASSDGGGPPAGEAPRLSVPRRVSLSSEWPLLVFTLTASILVGLFHARVLTGLALHPGAFASAGVAAMAVSTTHLARKRRFYRAILNWRRSWLSREILLFSLFLLGAVASLHLGEAGVFARVVSAVGFLALFAMDKVYHVRTNLSDRLLSSASVLLTGIYWVGLFSRLFWFIFPLGLVKLLLYVLREAPSLARADNLRQSLITARLAAGFVVPTGLWLATGTAHYSVILASILLGEITDRLGFYLELELTSPAAKAQADLEGMLARKGF